MGLVKLSCGGVPPTPISVYDGCVAPCLLLVLRDGRLVCMLCRLLTIPELWIQRRVANVFFVWLGILEYEVCIQNFKLRNCVSVI